MPAGDTYCFLAQCRSRSSDGRALAHIVEEHCELAGLREEVMETVTAAERILKGKRGELLAVRMIESEKALVVIYRELNNDDGFVITAFLTRRLESLERRTQLWPSPR